MNRFVATLKLDCLIQFRQGFYIVSVIVLLALAFWIPIVRNLASVLLPAVLLTNMMISTFVFLAGMLILEKGERTLEGQIVSPLRPEEYLLSKITSLAALALFENVVITGMALSSGFIDNVNWVLIVTGTLLCAVLYTLLGFLTIIRFDSISEFFVPMIVITTVLELPAFVCFGMPEFGWLYLLPSHGPMLLFLSGQVTLTTGQMFYAVVYPSAWIVAAFLFGRKALRRFVTGGIGSS